MRIELSQEDLMEAVESYIGEQGIAIEGKEVKVVITTNRTASITLTSGNAKTSAEVTSIAPKEPDAKPKASTEVDEKKSVFS